MRTGGADRRREWQRPWWQGLLCGLMLWLVGAAQADEPVRVAVIIDDMGDHRALGERTVDLPGPITCSVLPHTPHARPLAEACYRAGKEVMLHVPMQAKNGADRGPGGVDIHMDQAAVEQAVADDLAAVPHVRGVNNHMGSLYTRHPGNMRWFLEALRAEGDYYFVDSRTTPRSVAGQVAQETGVPALDRHVFLDHDRDEDTIRYHFRRLVRLAERTGYGIAIGHPYPETLAVLEEVLPELAGAGIKLVPVSRLVELHGQEEENSHE